MPTLQQITCSIELSQSRAKLKEYGARYHDAAVEVFVAVPDEKVPFCVHISTEGYIAPGLAFFVFIDGEYHANRNRRRLRVPGPGVDKKYYEIDTVLRQKEEKIKGGGFIGRDWVFNELKIANADTASPQNLNYIHNVGTIEVVVLRCKPDSPSPQRMLKAPSVKPEVLAAVSASRHAPAAPAASPAKPPSAKVAPPKPKTATPAGSDAGFGGMFGLFDGANDLPDPSVFSFDGAGDLPDLSMTSDGAGDLPDLSMTHDGAGDLPDLSMTSDGAGDPLDQARINMILNARPTLNLAHPELSSPLSYDFDQYAGGGHRRGTSEPTVYTINSETMKPAEAFSPRSPSQDSQSTDEIRKAVYEANKNDAALQAALAQPLFDTGSSPQRSSRDQASDRLSPRENPQVDGYNSYPQVQVRQPWDDHGRDDIFTGDRYFGAQGKEREFMRERFRQQGIPVSPEPAPRVAFSPRDEVFNLPFHPRREQNIQYYQKFKDPVYLSVDVLDLDPIAAHDKGLTFNVSLSNYKDSTRHMERILRGLKDENTLYMKQYEETPPGRIRDAIKDTSQDLCGRENAYAAALTKIYKSRDDIMAGKTLHLHPPNNKVKEHSAPRQETVPCGQQQREQQPQKLSTEDGWNQTGQGAVNGGQQLHQSRIPSRLQQQLGHQKSGSITGSQGTEEHFGAPSGLQRQFPAQSNWVQSPQQHSPRVHQNSRIGGKDRQGGAPDWKSPQQSANEGGWHQQASAQSHDDGGWDQHSSDQKANDGGWACGGEQQQAANQWGSEQQQTPNQWTASQASKRSRPNKENANDWSTQQQPGGIHDAWGSNNDQQKSGTWVGSGDKTAVKSNAVSQQDGDAWNDDNRSNASHRSKQSSHATKKSAGHGWGASASQQQNNGVDTWGGEDLGPSNTWANIDDSGGQKASSNQGWGNSSNVGSKTQTRDFAFAQGKAPHSARGAASQVCGSTSGTPIVKSYFADWQRPIAPQHDSSGPDAIKRRQTARPAYQYPAKEMPSILPGKTGEVSHGVRVGKGAKYTHETGRPEYIDSMKKPFAVFSFKYRSKSCLEKLLKRPVTLETEPVDEAALKDKLLNLPRHKLVEELMMARAALSGHNARVSPASLKSAMKNHQATSDKAASDRRAGSGQKAPSNGGWDGEQKANSNGGWVAEHKASSNGGQGVEQKAASNANWGGNDSGVAGGWDGVDKRSLHSQSGGKRQGGSDMKSAQKTDGGGWSTNAVAPADQSWGGGNDNGWSTSAPAAENGGWGGNGAKWDGPAEYHDSPAIAFSGNAPPVDYEDGKEPSVSIRYESSCTPEHASAMPPAPAVHSEWRPPKMFENGKLANLAALYQSSYTPKQENTFSPNMLDRSPFKQAMSFENGTTPSVAAAHESLPAYQHQGASPSNLQDGLAGQPPSDYVDGKEPSIATGFESSYVSEQ